MLSTVKVVRSVFLVDLVSVDNSVKSPCQSICILDEAANGKDVCIGCWRYADEIQDWYNFSNEKKEKIIEQLEDRSAEF